MSQIPTNEPQGTFQKKDQPYHLKEDSPCANEFVIEDSLLKSEDVNKDITKILIDDFESIRKIYDPKENGNKPTDFHRCCDRSENTFVVVKGKNHLIGGYSDVSWSGNFDIKPTTGAFLIEFDTKNKIHHKMPLSKQFIFCRENGFPSFGYNYISESNWYENSKCFEIPEDFKHDKAKFRKISETKKEGRLDFGKSEVVSEFKILDWEVFEVVVRNKGIEKGELDNFLC